jgi:hypothetical protein
MKKIKHKLAALLLVPGLICLNSEALSAQPGLSFDREEVVTVVNRTGVNAGAKDPVGFGLHELFNAMQNKQVEVQTVSHWSQTDSDIFLVVGTTDNRMVARLLDKPDASLASPEGIFYQWVDTRAGKALVVSGTDERGLMYGLLELSERVKADSLKALDEVENTEQFPDNRVRGVDRFLQNPNTHEWVLSEDFWEYYLQQLARNRFNRLVLITGYDTGFASEYMRPPYPFLVNVPGFPEVQLTENFEGTRKEQIAMFRKVGQMSEQYGIDFVFGSWFHGKRNREGELTSMVEGLPESSRAYSEYCKRGMKTLLQEVPEIDGVQMRINWESGLGEYGKMAELFWKGIIESIGEVSRQDDRNVFLDLRAKGQTRQVRDWALEEGLNLSVPTKYTWEATGLPYHTSRMRIGELRNIDNPDRRQRYSYADFLYKSRPFDVFYRLWSIGTHRLLVWGDPDYARQFSINAGFGGGTGFEVTPPMSMTKGSWEIFEDQSLIHYDWQDQRYWAWYTFLGRLGYNYDADSEVWERAFSNHFGESGRDMLEAYRTAGKFLPLLTSVHLTKHPAFQNWGEIDTGGALFGENNVEDRHGETTYITAEPGDPGLFYGIDDYAEAYLADTLTAKYTPMQVSQLYMNIARSTRDILSTIREDVPEAKRDAEFRAHLLDFAITSDLAAYHSFKTLAALYLSLYQQTGEAAYLPGALDQMQAARGEWQSLASRTEDTYNDAPAFVRGNSGKNWAGRLPEMDADIERLQQLIDQEYPQTDRTHNPPDPNMNLGAIYASLSDDLPETWQEGKDLPVTLSLDTVSQMTLDECTLYYRRANLAEGRFNRIEMQKTDNGFKGVIPGAYITADYDLLVYMGGIQDDGNALIYPGLYNPNFPAPYHTIKTQNAQ